MKEFLEEIELGAEVLYQKHYEFSDDILDVSIVDGEEVETLTKSTEGLLAMLSKDKQLLIDDYALLTGIDASEVDGILEKKVSSSRKNTKADSSSNSDAGSEEKIIKAT